VSEITNHLANPADIALGVEIAERLKGLSDQSREAVFDTIFDFYCQYCGCEQGPKMVRCQCWRDE
jgi:hypothetical protein